MFCYCLLFLLSVSEREHSASYMAGKHSTTEFHPCLHYILHCPQVLVNPREAGLLCIVQVEK